MTGSRVVIIGAGHAGVGAAASLRQAGFGGDIVMIGDEDVLGYNRPPLSKAWLKGETSIDAIMLKPARFFKEQNIDLLLGRRAISIDRVGKSVALSDGITIDYEFLILAMGARARPLQLDHPIGHLLSLRSIADAEELKQALAPGKRLGIVGGGYIGLEVAASARALGCEVIILERESRLLPRVAGADLAVFFRAVHERQGVTFETGATVAGVEDDGGVLTGLLLSDGRKIACDAVLVGIGALANSELAEAAGLDCPNGVRVDGEARTSDPSIFAIGDLSFRPLPLYANIMFRLESVPNALEQGRQAAAAICGKPAPRPETPWFWSDQYDIKLQIAGLAINCDRTIVRGDPDAGKFAVLHLDGDRLRAVEAVNMPVEFMGGRVLIAMGGRIDPARIADQKIPLKDCIA